MHRYRRGNRHGARWARIDPATLEEAEADMGGMRATALLEESPEGQEGVNPRCRLSQGLDH